MLGWIKSLVPRSWKESVKAQYRSWAFSRAVTEARAVLTQRQELSDALLAKLVMSWGNESWSAREEFLRAIVREAGQGQGPILECGSGLSTLLMGLAIQGTSRHVYALEHHPEWAQRVGGEARRLGLTQVSIVLSPLRDFGPFSWYGPPPGAIPDKIGMVVCDGPPDTTPGGRYGLLPRMRSSLAPGCILFLDDLERVGEQEILARWAAELGSRSEVFGTAKPYGRVDVPNA